MILKLKNEKLKSKSYLKVWVNPLLVKWGVSYPLPGTCWCWWTVPADGPRCAPECPALGSAPEPALASPESLSACRSDAPEPAAWRLQSSLRHTTHTQHTQSTKRHGDYSYWVPYAYLGFFFFLSLYVGTFIFYVCDCV